jgi:hypothetical protein
MIHDCPHMQATLEMFKGKGSTLELYKEEATINVVLVMTTQSRIMD